MKRYPALHMVSSLLKTISVIVILGGLGLSFWVLFGGDLVLGEFYPLSRVIAIAGILGSVIVGIILYAMGDFFRCVMDIEANTRPQESTLPH